MTMQENFHPSTKPKFTIHGGQVFVRWTVSNTGIQPDGEWATDFATKTLIFTASEAQHFASSLNKCLDDLIIEQLAKKVELYDHHALDGEPPVV